MAVLKTYKVTHEKFEGYLLVTYQDTRFKSCLNEIKTPINREIWENFRNNLPYTEKLLGNIVPLGFEVIEKEYDNSDLKGKVGYERVKLFCELYKEVTNRQYKVLVGEGKKIKEIPVTEKHILYYLKSTNFLWNNKWSISNICRYWNELLTEIATGNPAMVWPKYYSAEYERNLLPAQVGYYHQSLIKRGLIPIRDNHQHIIGFREEKTATDYVRQTTEGFTIAKPKLPK